MDKRKLALVVVVVASSACAAPSPSLSPAGSSGLTRTPAAHESFSPSAASTPSGTAISTSPSGSRPSLTPAGTPPTPTGTQLIRQPQAPAGLDIAPDSARVDLQMPTFGNPTQVDNPLFPVSAQESVLMLGHVDGEPFRTEVTLLADPRVITWNGQHIEALVSQYNAYLDGRINEVAYDFYAQDDAGNVWYLGEDVFDFSDGVITSTEGTWLAGRDGPGAMIMPADPQVGDVYRPENAPPLVFEEVTVQEAGVVLDGPLGSVPGGLVIRELHLDGGTEEKQFAPGYGEFYTADGKDVEALAMAVPTDTLGTAVPEQLAALTDATLALIDDARGGSWDAAGTHLSEAKAAWSALPATESPTTLADVMDGWMSDLSAGVEARDGARTQRAAIEAARSAFDLQLRHRPVVDVDLARMDLWAAEIRLDAENDDGAGVGSDAFAMDYVRDRIQHRIVDSDLGAIDSVLAELGVAVIDEDLTAIPEISDQLREVLAAIQP